jgi:hypothetical protein
MIALASGLIVARRIQKLLTQPLPAADAQLTA